MTFRKLAANSDGKLIRAYLTEHTPEPEPDADLEPGARPDAGGRLTAYYTGRDSRAAWPELTETPFGTHKQTKQERITSRKTLQPWFSSVFHSDRVCRIEN